jgi:WD40 repeat protein
VIKLWQNRYDNTIQLNANFEGHVDWVNDLAISQNLLFSCSNDKTVMIWNLNNCNGTVDPAYQKHLMHKDYIKALCYCNYNNTLYASGYDGLITYYNIDEYNKSGSIRYDNSGELMNMKDKSIYSISCDTSGKLLLASIYENVISGIDLRQKKEIYHLRGHNGIIREVKLSPDGKMVKFTYLGDICQQ